MTPLPCTETRTCAPGVVNFSTDDVRAAERVSFWKEAICTTFVRLDLDCDPDRPFRSTLAVRSLARFDCISVGGSAQRVSRTERMVGEDRSDSLILMRQRLGECLATQDGRELRMPAGGLTLVDCRRPYVLRFPGDFHQTVLKVPVRELEQRLGRGVSRSGHVLDTGSALGRLTALAIDELAAEPRDSLALPLANVAFDLLALALAENASSAAPGLAAMRVSWAKAHVLNNLHDPALSPQSVADRQGVSLRLLQRLFAAGGDSLAAFILEQRLQRCHDALRDRAQAGRSITEIALGWGFNDPAHLSKVFRRRFGLSPRESRLAPHDR